MARRASALAIAARPAAAPSRLPIGFAVRDATGLGAAFELDVGSAEALVFGSSSAMRVTGPGVLPAHAVVLPVAGKLVAASASAEHPAFLNGAPLPATWTMLAVPSRICIGTAVIDFFFLRESGTVVIDQDVETTVADPGSRRLDTSRIRRTTTTRTSPRTALLGAVIDLKVHWRNAPTSTRVLLGVVAILVAFLLAR
jgi:hypothetical protein